MNWAELHLRSIVGTNNGRGRLACECAQEAVFSHGLALFFGVNAAFPRFIFPITGSSGLCGRSIRFRQRNNHQNDRNPDFQSLVLSQSPGRAAELQDDCGFSQEQCDGTPEGQPGARAGVPRVGVAGRQPGGG